MSKRTKLFEIGEKIGVVEIIGRVYNERRREWEYLCRCRCGNEFRSRRDHLLKPRQGCKACINKVKADIDLAGTISEEEYNKRLNEKILVKKQKRDLIEKLKIERANAKIEKERIKIERKEKFNRASLTSPIWIGQRFDRLTVIDSYVGLDNGRRQTHWVLQCDCGNVVDRIAKFVKIGTYVSCGCKSKEIVVNAVSNERLYSIWQGIKNRCFNIKNSNWHNYGGRGITMCEEWKNSYKAFRDWAYKNGWTEDVPDDHNNSLSIERKNVNSNYEPSNCCFLPLREQNKNKRPYSECNKKVTKKDKIKIEINGVIKSQREWQNEFSISDSMLSYRLKQGISIDKALSEPKFSKKILYK